MTENLKKTSQRNLISKSNVFPRNRTIQVSGQKQA